MIESRLLVAKPLRNQSRPRLLYFSRSEEATAYTTAPLPRLASGFYFACAKVLFARSKSFRQSEIKDLIQQKSAY